MENNNDHKSLKTILLDKQLWLFFAAELLGTGVLLFMCCGSTLTWPSSSAPSILHMALASGITLVILIMSFGHITGGHVNPVVTLGFIVSGRLRPLDGLFIVCGQFLGGVLGTALLYGLTPSEVRNAGLGVTVPASNLHLGQAVGMEVFLTFLLIFVVHAVTDTNRFQRFPEHCAPFIIGFCLFVCLMIGIPFSGSSLNPVRSFAPALVTNSWKHHWVYWVGPVLGSIAAALLYEKVFSAKKCPGTQEAELKIRDNSL